MCPCHGGAYYSDGSRASGPPERGLSEYRYTVEQGNLLVHAGQMPTTGVPVARLTKISLDKPPCVSSKTLVPGSKPAFSSPRRFGTRWNIRCRARRRVGLTC